MPIGRRNPFEEFQDIIDRMTREFENMDWRFERDMPSLGQGISVDVADHDDEFVVTADLPGFDKEDIDVTLLDTTLRIEAQREEAVDEEQENFIRQERRHATVSRSVDLPQPIDKEGTSATYRHGVLTLRLPKVDDDQGARIDIE